MKAGRTLTQLAQEIERQAAAKQDFVADARDVTMSPDTNELQFASTVAEPTDHCHRQLASWTGIGTRYYDKMREASPALLAGNVNHWLHEDTEKERRRMIRTLDGRARAWLSDRYLRLDNEHIAEHALTALGAVNEVQIASCDVTDRKLYIKAVFPRVEGEVQRGDVVQSGVVITNSEIGGGSLNVQPLLYRLVCLNGMISGFNTGDGYRRTHLGSRVKTDGIVYQQDTIEAAAKAAMLEVRDAVTQFASPDYFNGIIGRLQSATEGPRVERPIRAVEELGKVIGLPQGEQEGIAERLLRAGDYSRYGMLNAVTNLANETESYDRATELEELGGRILDLHPSQWSRIAEAA